MNFVNFLRASFYQEHCNIFKLPEVLQILHIRKKAISRIDFKDFKLKTAEMLHVNEKGRHFTASANFSRSKRLVEATST